MDNTYASFKIELPQLKREIDSLITNKDRLNDTTKFELYFKIICNCIYLLYNTVGVQYTNISCNTVLRKIEDLMKYVAIHNIKYDKQTIINMLKAMHADIEKKYTRQECPMCYNIVRNMDMLTCSGCKICVCKKCRRHMMHDLCPFCRGDHY